MSHCFGSFGVAAGPSGGFVGSKGGRPSSRRSYPSASARQGRTCTERSAEGSGLTDGGPAASLTPRSRLVGLVDRADMAGGKSPVPGRAGEDASVFDGVTGSPVCSAWDGARVLGRFGRPRTPDKATLASCRAASSRVAALACVRGAGRSAAAFSSLAQSRAGSKREEPMTTTNRILLDPSHCRHRVGGRRTDCGVARRTVARPPTTGRKPRGGPMSCPSAARSAAT